MLSRAFDILRRDLAGLQRVATADSGAMRYLFTGSDRKLSLVTLEPPYPTTAGPYFVEYSVQSNHVHLLATGAREESLSKAVQAMGRRYVSYFNYLHGRTGTLWEGRFRSCPVESDRYFLVCHRYVELNPVRAGMTGHPGEFAWSSFRCNALGSPDDLVTPHSLYMELAGADQRRRAAYRSDRRLPTPMSPHSSRR